MRDEDRDGARGAACAQGIPAAVYRQLSRSYAGTTKEAAMVTGAHHRPRREPAGYHACQEGPVRSRLGH